MKRSWDGTKTFLRKIATLVYLKNILIPRCLELQAFEDLHKCQLHYFVNASKLAYGAVCYIRTITRNDVVVC